MTRDSTDSPKQIFRPTRHPRSTEDTSRPTTPISGFSRPFHRFFIAKLAIEPHGSDSTFALGCPGKISEKIDAPRKPRAAEPFTHGNWSNTSHHSVVVSIMDRPLRVLVCSGNMGNALPDPESIAAWIPNDGCYFQVVEKQEYPIPSKQETDALFQEIGLPPLKEAKANGTSNNTSNGSIPANANDDYFDIIVVGMQEATFAVEDEKGEIRKDLLPIVTPLLNKAQKELKKTTQKGVATVTTLTGSTDHTSNSKKLVPEWLKAQDSSILHQLLQDQCPSYDFAIRFQRGEMRLEVMVRKDLEAQVLSVRAQNTGLINLAANKGGIVGVSRE
jgi:hypothetical protein